MIARWPLLCALAFAVVGMHHLASLCQHDDETAVVAMVSAAPMHVLSPPRDDCCGDQLAMPTGTHDLLHLCLAILAAGLALGALLVRWRRAGVTRGLLPPLAGTRRRAPRPPPGAAALATSLGVFRL